MARIGKSIELGSELGAGWLWVVGWAGERWGLTVHIDLGSEDDEKF